jgi:hypothetical protein
VLDCRFVHVVHQSTNELRPNKPAVDFGGRYGRGMNDLLAED